MAKKIEWTDAARADVRRIDRQAAMRILEGICHFLLLEEVLKNQRRPGVPPRWTIKPPSVSLTSRTGAKPSRSTRAFT